MKLEPSHDEPNWREISGNTSSTQLNTQNCDIVLSTDSHKKGCAKLPIMVKQYFQEKEMNK